MSASLVGSEMCIRDSPPELLSEPFGVHRSSPKACKGRSELRNIFLGPVSYTHLTLPTICSV
eukprot:5003683-Alexandrium_andersonii.AAC.1